MRRSCRRPRARIAAAAGAPTGRWCIRAAAAVPGIPGSSRTSATTSARERGDGPRRGGPLPRRLPLRSRRSALRPRRRSGRRLPRDRHRHGARRGGQRPSAVHRRPGRRGHRGLPTPLRHGGRPLPLTRADRVPHNRTLHALQTRFARCAPAAWPRRCRCSAGRAPADADAIPADIPMMLPPGRKAKTGTGRLRGRVVAADTGADRPARPGPHQQPGHRHRRPRSPTRRDATSSAICRPAVST